MGEKRPVMGRRWGWLGPRQGEAKLGRKGRRWGKKARDRARGRWGRIGGGASKMGEKPAAGRRPKRPEEMVSGLG